jgi:hypothetical protein
MLKFEIAQEHTHQLKKYSIDRPSVLFTRVLAELWALRPKEAARRLIARVCDRVHFLFGQGEVECMKIFVKTLDTTGGREGATPSLHTPAEQDLRSCFPMRCSGGSEWSVNWTTLELLFRERRERTICCDQDRSFGAPAEQFRLLQVRVSLNPE